jgi:hypothetical protein
MRTFCCFLLPFLVEALALSNTGAAQELPKTTRPLRFLTTDGRQSFCYMALQKKAVWPGA